MQRCAWAQHVPAFYQKYHDEEWGVPVHNDTHFFEMLILEGAQAGLSWQSILQRREGYRAAFKGFAPAKVAAMTDVELETVLKTGDIIKNRLKVFSARKNAQAFLKIQQEYGSFDAYVWPYVGGQPRLNKPASMQGVPAQTAASEALSQDLKKRGMSFVGPTIMYAFMQATGLVNDHTQGCFCCPK